jgi:hypothetical protein
MLEGNKFTAGMSVIAGIVGKFFPAPLVIENFFYYGLAVVGAAVGIIAANKSKRLGAIIAVIGIIIIAVISGFFYIYLLNTVDTPEIWTYIIEGFLFIIFISTFFFAARLGDLSSK